MSQLPIASKRKEEGGLRSGLIRKLLHQCLGSHRICAQKKLQFPRGARIVDCDSRQVVSLEDGVEYLALSYVWGWEHHVSRDYGLEETLPETLPQTIEDAIHVTRVLGYRYLWVDRYCIEQGHSTHKAQQIKEMANIYSYATVTLCSWSDGADAGIYGISLAYPEGFDPFTNYWFKKNPWSERAWTLQELVTSPRCLFFERNRVIMACLERLKDDFLLREEPLDPANVRNLDRENVLFSALVKTEEGRFKALRGEYQTRTLSYSADGLNAFRAILEQMRAPSYWGVPIFDEISNTNANLAPSRLEALEHGFVSSLLWTATRPEQGFRRSSGVIPSWTWASSSQAVYMLEPSGARAFTARTSVVDVSGECIPLSEYVVQGGAQSVIPELSMYLEFRSVHAHWIADPNPAVAWKPTVRFTSTSNGQWRRLLPHVKAHIYFDQRAKGSNTPAPWPTQGEAILLTQQAPGSSVAGPWIWLALRTRNEKGTVTHFRDGLIELITKNVPAEMDIPVLPATDALSSFKVR